MLESARGEDGEIAFEDVDDPLIAKWEAEMAMGLEPDLTEGLGEQAKASLEKEKEKYQRAKEMAKKASSIDERFDDAIRRNPMYETKNAGTLGNSNSTNLIPDGVLGRGEKK